MVRSPPAKRQSATRFAGAKHCLVIRRRSRPRGRIVLEDGTQPITAAMPPEQLNQIAEAVRNNLLNHLDREVDRAMGQLGITDEISDDEWQSLVDLILG